MKTIQIESPVGFIPSFDPEKCVLTFSEAPKNIRERLQTIADVFKYNGITEKAFEKKYADLEPDEKGYIMEKLIANAYNEGKKPNWSDGNPKGVLFFEMDSSPSGGGFRFNVVDFWNSRSHVGSRLVFVGPEWQENAKDAANKFLDIYKLRTS